MKKKLCLLLSCVLVFSLTGCGSSGSKSDDASKKESSDTIVVGTEAGFAPYEFMKGKEVVGIDMDIAQKIADSLDKKLEIKNMDFDGALLAVSQGTVDFVAAGVSVTPEREKNMDFSDNYIDSTDVVVVNESNPKLTSAKELDGKVIGVQQGNVADLWCSNEENVKPKEVKRYTQFALAAQDLQNEKIDCIVMDEVPAKELISTTDGIKILEGDDNVVFQDQYAIAVKKGNTELKEQINSVLKDLKDSGELDKIVAKYANAKDE